MYTMPTEEDMMPGFLEFEEFYDGTLKTTRKRSSDDADRPLLSYWEVGCSVNLADGSSFGMRTNVHSCIRYQGYNTTYAVDFGSHESPRRR